jgi:hypothetical protein
MRAKVTSTNFIFFEKQFVASNQCIGMRHKNGGSPAVFFMLYKAQSKM